MKPKGQETGAYQYRDDELEANIDAAKGWINESNNDSRRIAFRHMANLIAKRNAKYVAELDAQLMGDYL